MKTEAQSAEFTHTRAQAKLTELARERTELAEKLEVLGRPDDPREDAEAVLAGKAIDGPSKSREQAASLERRLAAIEAAIPMQKQRVREAELAWHEAVREEAAVRARKAGQELAELAVAFSEKASQLHETLTDLDGRGIPRLHILPGLNLKPLRADVPESRLNTFVDELTRDGYAKDVQRRVLDAARESRQRAHLAEEERKRKAGGAVTAGPDGVKEFLPGGTVKPPPQPARSLSIPLGHRYLQRARHIRYVDCAGSKRISLLGNSRID